MAGLNSRVDPQDLVSFDILSTGYFTLSGKPQLAYWKNNFGVKIEIVGVKIGIWGNFGMRADMVVGLWRDADNSEIVSLGWDHYADPPLPRQEKIAWFAPYKWDLFPGDLLRMIYSFNAFIGIPGASFNVAIYCPAGGGPAGRGAGVDYEALVTA